MEGASTSVRFKSVETSTFIEANENSNTLRKTMGHLNILREYFEIKGESREIYNIPPNELDPLLSNFIVNVRTKSGEEYEPSSLRGMIGSFERHLKRHRYQFSLITSFEFARCREALRAKQKDLKAQGRGNKPQRSDSLTPDEIETLYNTEQLGKATPTSLISTLWFNNTLYFGMRGGTEHRNMRWGDVVLKRDEALQLDYLEYHERATKTRTGVDVTDSRACPPRMYATPANPEKCPVSTYILYRDKRPEGYSKHEDPFYISVVTNEKRPRMQDRWFICSPMGVNKLNDLMKRMSKNAGLPDNKKITNTSVRKTLVQRMTDSNVPDTLQVYVTGHKNIQSLNNYRTINDSQKYAISSILSNSSSNISSLVPFSNASTQNHSRFETSSSTRALRNSTVTHAQPFFDLRPISDNTAIETQNNQVNMQRSTSTSMGSIFSGSQIHGNVTVNITNNTYQSRKRVRVIDSDSD
ncbi:uncharacterized protein LOC133204775 [Saccostrea echinata]|uniref:uncharacterized protein LOC133204775 n=1 Tax=Saccostrea echinata TaxID=191078 RepID=UPI002A80DD36|nr:uncharacterized protein LOC133204775 [Saccostrea echinata]